MFVVLYIYVTLYNHLRIGVFNVDSYPSIPLYPIKCSQHNIPNSWLVHFRPAPPRQPWAVCPWECSSLSRGAVVNHIIHTYIYIIIYIYIQLCFIILYYRRKFRSQTSDNMDRWKAEMGRVREEKRRKKIREEKESSQKTEDAGARKGGCAKR